MNGKIIDCHVHLSNTVDPVWRKSNAPFTAERVLKSMDGPYLLGGDKVRIDVGVCQPAIGTTTYEPGGASAFEKQHKYADAVRSYKEALRFAPGEAKATAAFQFAQRMDNGQKAAAARKFADAVREYQEALKLSPNQPDALDALKRAREGKP